MVKEGLNTVETTIKSMSEIDILRIDSRIKEKFEREAMNLPKYKDQLQSVIESLEIENLSLRVKNKLWAQKKELEYKISIIENNSDFDLYVAKTAKLIQEYQRLLRVPLKMSFVGKVIKDDSAKQEIIRKYVIAAQFYVDDKIHIEKYEEKKDKCLDCNGTEFEIEDGDVYICINCFSQQRFSQSISSYNDVERVNVTSKYLYERKVHFRDCLKQYQGKQNCTIGQKVYDDLEEQFRLHHLLVGDKDTPKEIKFKKITKLHIMMFLKDLGYTKHYENVHLIHYYFTGVKPVNLSHLEPILMDDFEILSEEYDKQNINRKNFINTHYVLYQLLRRHKFPCKPYDFPELRTPDRKCFHDEICRKLFERLGWNHHSYF